MYIEARFGRTGRYEQCVALHYVLSLCVWISVELLVLAFFLNLGEGPLPTLNSIANASPEALWTYVRPFFQCALIVQSLTTVYDYLDGKLKGPRALFRLEHILRIVAVYFVAIPALKQKLPLRLLLIAVTGWTLLSIVRGLDTIYVRQGAKNNVVEWFHHKLFMLLYPLLSFVELTLMTKAAAVIRYAPIARDFPSRMPNVYNFQCDLYIVFQVLILVTVPSAVAFYVYNVYHRKFKTI